MSSIKSILVAASLLGILAACSSPTVRMGDEPPADIDRAAGRPISASACGYQLVGLIPIASNSRQQRAYDSLQQQAGGDFVGDVVLTEEWYYGVVGTVYCTQLDAKAYPKRSS